MYIWIGCVRRVSPINLEVERHDTMILVFKFFQAELQLLINENQ